MKKQPEIFQEEWEAEVKAHILCKQSGLNRPKPDDYSCPYKFLKDEKEYNDKFKYFYGELLAGRMQVL